MKKRADKIAPSAKTYMVKLKLKAKLTKLQLKQQILKEKSGTSEKVTSAAGTDNNVFRATKESVSRTIAQQIKVMTKATANGMQHTPEHCIQRSHI